MARCIGEQGASTFIDANDLNGGDAFETEIRTEIGRSDELVALFTPLSARRAWVFMEIGAAWAQNKRVCGVLYGLTLDDMEREDAGGAGLLNNRNTMGLNDFDRYLRELKQRCDDGR